MVVRLFECFCGYGGAHWGLKLAGIPTELVGYSEIKKHAIQCYEKNFPESVGKNYGDITLIDWSKVPDFDLLTGGFPCQDISTQGKQDLSVGRSVLVNNLIDALKVKQPKWFLFENVSAIEHYNFREFLLKIERDLRACGYQVFRCSLNSSDFGGVTIRERVWFIGYRNDLKKEFGFSPYPTHSNEFRVIKDILEPQFVLAKQNVFTDILVDGFDRRKREVINLGKYRQSVFESNYRIVSVNGLCGTLTCRDTDFCFSDKGLLREISVKEMFRLMGFFGDEINIDGLSRAKCIDLAGDGWDVNLAKQIFLKMGFN